MLKMRKAIFCVPMKIVDNALFQPFFSRVNSDIEPRIDVSTQKIHVNKAHIDEINDKTNQMNERNKWNESSTTHNNSLREYFRFVFNFAAINAEFLRNSLPTSAIFIRIKQKKTIMAFERNLCSNYGSCNIRWEGEKKHKIELTTDLIVKSKSLDILLEYFWQHRAQVS